MAEYKGRSCVVTAVSGEIPEVTVDGKVRKLNSTGKYQPVRAAGFAPGMIHFRDQRSSSESRSLVYNFHGNAGMYGQVPGGTLSESGQYHCVLASESQERGCFVAVVFFRTEAGGGPDLTTAAIAFSDVGDLEPGREKAVRIDCAYIAPQGARYYFFPIVFSRGVEIRSDQSENAASFFRQLEMRSHAEALRSYAAEGAGKDRPALPYLRIPPQFPPGFDLHALPATIRARFAVTESGEVDGVYHGEGIEPGAARDITRALDGWLFLPALRKGYPVRVPVEIPLAFGP